MYLVVIEKHSLESEGKESFYLSPKVEKLQAFSYQLRTKSWSVIDCVPEKGSVFEVHFGDQQGKEDESDFDVLAVAICHDPATAIYWAKTLTNLFSVKEKDRSKIISGGPMWDDLICFVDGLVDADGMFTEFAHRMHIIKDRTRG